MNQQLDMVRPRPLRWCFVSPGDRSLRVLEGDTCASGGAEAQIALLARSFAKRGDVVALIHGHGRGDGAERFVSGIRCIDAAAAWRRPRSLATFWRALHRVAPNILYARLPSDFLYFLGLFARSRPGTRFVYALAHDQHCTPASAYDHNAWFHGPLYGLGLRSAAKLVIQHRGQRDLLSPPLRERTVHIPNLVQPISTVSRCYERTIYDAVWIAKIRQEKHLEKFLRMAALLPHLRFAVIGGFDPELPPELRVSLTEALAAGSNVAYLGPHNAPEVAAVMAKSRVLVNTSAAEGFPNTMLEAWSQGVPVVSLTVDPGGVIERERLGLFSGNEAKLNEDVDALARTHDVNRACGERGRAYVQRQHSLDAVHAAFANALSSNGLRILPST